MKALALVVLLTACRISWGPHMGVPARQSNVTTFALFAKDDAARRLAREVLARDPHIKLVEGDAPDTEQCAWAAAHGAELYAVAWVDAGYSSTFQCTHYSGGIWTKNETCDEGHVTDEHTAANYTLTTYATTTCKAVPRLEAKFSARALGEEEQSKPEALANLAERVRAQSQTLPDQVTIDGEGRIVGDAHDGFYAVYRAGQYRGYVQRQGEYVRPMYCCLDLEPGDALVERGRRKFLELGLDAVASQIDGKFASGAGVHLRHYALDGGFQLGIGADALSLSESQSMSILSAEVGWGIPIAPGFVASANLGVGRAFVKSADSVDVGVVVPMLRVQTFLTTWWFVAVEAGVLISNERSPISRITAGFDL